MVYLLISMSRCLSTVLPDRSDTLYIEEAQCCQNPPYLLVNRGRLRDKFFLFKDDICRKWDASPGEGAAEQSWAHATNVAAIWHCLISVYRPKKCPSRYHYKLSKLHFDSEGCSYIFLTLLITEAFLLYVAALSRHDVTKLSWTQLCSWIWSWLYCDACP